MPGAGVLPAHAAATGRVRQAGRGARVRLLHLRRRQDRGGHGWTVVDRSTSPPRLRHRHRREEAARAAHLEQVLGILEEGVDGASWSTFVMPSYPGDPDPALDLDAASHALVRTLPAGSGTGHCGLPWEPEQACSALARRYGGA